MGYYRFPKGSTVAPERFYEPPSDVDGPLQLLENKLTGGAGPAARVRHWAGFGGEDHKYERRGSAAARIAGHGGGADLRLSRLRLGVALGSARRARGRAGVPALHLGAARRDRGRDGDGLRQGERQACGARAPHHGGRAACGDAAARGAARAHPAGRAGRRIDRVLGRRGRSRRAPMAAPVDRPGRAFAAHRALRQMELRPQRRHDPPAHDPACLPDRDGAAEGAGVRLRADRAPR